MKKILKLPLHYQILISIVAGVIFALVYVKFRIDPDYAKNWIKPFGDIFVRLLKMIAVPLVVASLISGVANLGDVKKLSSLGTKTIAIYLSTTVLATSVGLILVNIIQPGKYMDKQTRDSIVSTSESQNKSNLEKKKAGAKAVQNSGYLQPLVDMVPDNVFKAMSSNGSMLQVVFFSIIIGIASLYLGAEQSGPLIKFMDSLNEHIMKVIEFIMAIAPIGVFCLISALLIDVAGKDPANALNVLKTLGAYSLTVIAGLAMMALLVYPTVLKVFSNMKIKDFFKGIAPAQLLAFSTSSSAATLPITMECVENELGVNEEVSSFVLPLGATVNMDGTCLYQSVAAVFIMQCFGIDLSITAQLMIVVTATLASIGSAAVPGAGMVMLIIVLQAIQPENVDPELYTGIIASGIALIMAPDRFLDMCRTTVNVTGDCAVTVAVAGKGGRTRNTGLED
ncbi:MAG: dicarboxylate/amino acid:cation symporter [Lentisphaeraceae bacterium]|nr:dicarboxylate/amino acid:cation symporter [Lentisphaeraceae bacterium]